MMSYKKLMMILLNSIPIKTTLLIVFLSFMLAYFKEITANIIFGIAMIIGYHLTLFILAASAILAETRSDLLYSLMIFFFALLLEVLIIIFFKNFIHAILSLSVPYEYIWTINYMAMFFLCFWWFQQYFEKFNSEKRLLNPVEQFIQPLPFSTLDLSEQIREEFLEKAVGFKNLEQHKVSEFELNQMIVEDEFNNMTKNQEKPEQKNWEVLFKKYANISFKAGYTFLETKQLFFFSKAKKYGEKCVNLLRKNDCDLTCSIHQQALNELSEPDQLYLVSNHKCGVSSHVVLFENFDDDKIKWIEVCSLTREKISEGKRIFFWL